MKSPGAAQSTARLHDLLEAIAEGDRPALEQLYQLTCDKLYGVVHRILRERVLAEDALVDAYVRIWERPRDYDPRLMDATSWMVSVARRAALDLARKSYVSGHEVTEAGEATEEVPETPQPQMSETLKALLARLASLSEDQRTMMLLAYYDGWSREALSVEFDAPEETIRTWLLAGLNELRDDRTDEPA